MSLLEAMRLALAQIRVQKLKSSFTLLGVMIGVMFLIAVVSLVEGMTRYMEDDFVGRLMGINTFSLRRMPDMSFGDVTEDMWREWQRRPRLRESDVQPVVSAMPADAHWAVESESNVFVESPFARPKQVQASTVSGDWFDIKHIAPAQGRLISPVEYQLGTPVLVVGQDVAKAMFPDLDPIGRQLKIGGIPYTIVGVAESQGTIFGISLDKFVVAPDKSPLQRLTNPHGVIDAITVQAVTKPEMYDLMEAAREVMRARRRLRPAQPDNFDISTSATALAFFDKIKGKMVIFGAVLPAIGLVVGAIVIMNIMLVAVAERTREIGIRKAIGARRRDILAQFLAEAATLSTLGAAIGIALGIGLSQLVALVSPLPAAVAPWSIVAGVIVGAGVGIVAGVYPASRAARLDPIAALRQE